MLYSNFTKRMHNLTFPIMLRTKPLSLAPFHGRRAFFKQKEKTHLRCVAQAIKGHTAKCNSIKFGGNRSAFG